MKAGRTGKTTRAKDNRLFVNCFFLLFIFTLPFVGIAQIKDSTQSKNIFFLHTNYPVPASGVTFQRIFTGLFNFNGGYQRLVYKKLSTGLGFDFAAFQTSNKVLDTKTTMNVISPSLNAGVLFVAFKKILIHPIVQGGYAFISYNGKDAEGNPKPKFNEQGAFVQSSVFAGYLINQKISVGLNTSYRVIFQHFGTNTTLEDNTIRILDFGLGITCKL